MDLKAATQRHIDYLIEQLEQASQESASGKKSWDEFCIFLTNFETLAQLNDPANSDIALLTRRKHICYYVANDDLNKDPKLAAEVLPRIAQLVKSDIFPREADFFVLCDWIQQVAFIFNLTLPGYDEFAALPVEALDQALTISKQLVGFCLTRLKHEKIHQASLDLSAFEKACDIAKHGVSHEFESDTNLKAVGLIELLANLIDERQIVATISDQQLALISGKLWSIVQEDLRYIVMNCCAFSNKISRINPETYQALHKAILAIIEILPANNEALGFFSNNLTKISRPEYDTADLTILNSILRGRHDDADGIWPILDIHMSRSEPKIRVECLDIAIGLFGSLNKDMSDFKAMLDHLDVIINDVSESQSECDHNAMYNVIVLLTYIPRCDEPTKNEIQLRLIRILKDLQVQHLNEEILGPVIKAFSDGHAFPLDADLFRDIALKKFKLIYHRGVDQENHLEALKALYSLIATEGKRNTSYKRKYIDIVAAGCQGLPPKGCNKAMFNVLKRTKVMVKEDNEMCLLPLTRVVYDPEDVSEDSF